MIYTKAFSTGKYCHINIDDLKNACPHWGIRLPVACYICPAEKILHPQGKNIKYHKYVGSRYMVKIETCQNCLQQNKCLKKGSSRRLLFITKIPPDQNYTNRMIEKIDREKSRQIYSMRMGIVEPVFGNITWHKRLNRFTLRSKERINIQWKLYMTIQNIEKLSNYSDKYKKGA